VSRRRRAALLAGLALVLGGLAASDVAGREAALRNRLGPVVDVVVARTRVPAGGRLTPARLAVRHVPARFAPRGAFSSPAELAGLRAAGALVPGQDITAATVQAGRTRPIARIRKGERIADVIAVAAADLIQPGVRVDVVVTTDSRPGSPGRTVLALEDVEVVSASPAPAPTRADQGEQARVAASLLVRLREAVYLAAAQTLARELRLLPRAPGDRRRGAEGLAFDGRLG
jgi:pilus assembly protein CpaB